MDGLEWFYDAFTDLSSTRPVGMGVGHIPWTAIDRWAVRNEVDGEDFDDLVYMMREMDAEFFDLQDKKAKRQADSEKDKRGLGRGG